nr:adenylate kinase family protein [Archaeoglobus neptunius]
MIALTGTPGTGKTAVAEKLKKRGLRVESVIELARKNDSIIDEEGDEVVIDVERLSKTRFDGIVEGHLSHLLSPDLTVVLRCNPLVLKKRLEERGWSEEKVMENVEAELLDVILVEALESCPEVYEVDTTNLKVDDVADIVEGIVRGDAGLRRNYKPGKIDWLSELEERLDEVVRK